MRLNRKIDRSIYYWLDDLVHDSVNVEDGFPSGELVLPTVSITNLDIEGMPFELGGDEQNWYFWRIDVFAKNKEQRDELAYQIFDCLEDNITVQDYDEGFPPSVTPSRIGTLVVSKRKLRPIHVFKDLVEKIYWRSSITFFTYYETVT